MSNKLFQNVIAQYRGMTDRVIGVAEDDGTVVACSSSEGPFEIRLPGNSDRVMIGVSGLYISEGFTLRPMNGIQKSQYTVFVEGTDKTADTVSGLLAVSLTNMKRLYDERYDRSTLVRNIVLDNILPDEISVRAKEMHIPLQEQKVIMIIRNNETNDNTSIDVLQNMFPDRQRDFLFPVGEHDTVLVKSLKPGNGLKYCRETATRIVDTFSTELFRKIKIGMSSISDSLRTLPVAYREAGIALEVCDIFGNERSVAEYEHLGLGRLLYLLPVPLCRKYLNEVLGNDCLTSLDPEILTTIQAFFDNSLNVSETSRQLFIHRNTLIYRLEKIEKLTGLDLRNFEDAITFRVALMVNRYLEAKESQKNTGSGINND